MNNAQDIVKLSTLQMVQKEKEKNRTEKFLLQIHEMISFYL